MNPPPFHRNNHHCSPTISSSSQCRTQKHPITSFGKLVEASGTRRSRAASKQAPILAGWLLIFGIIGVAIYGTVVGAQSGGAQMWIAPAKLGLGTLLAVLICLPSLYIFTCLGGIDAQLRSVCGALFAAVCLSSILLIGFAPVAWIFSQSTDSIPFMARCTCSFG